MATLDDFARRLERKLSATQREPRWAPDEADRYMASIAHSRRRWQELASRLSTTVIRPRLEMLVGFFPHAKVAANEPIERNSCWFGYCERFPATVRLSFAMEHDVRYENAIVSYEVQMVPLFIKFNACDKLTLPLEQLDETTVSNWIEERLWEFLDGYFQIDRGGDNFADEVVSDPVCGMRIGRATAAATAEYLGHPYFFCSSNCQAQFLIDPRQYVHVKT